jgi:hypothetical protein
MGTSFKQNRGVLPLVAAEIGTVDAVPEELS